jgi:hypothetical protein
MSWAQVDFSLVRYSPIEGTHFFYDLRYPSAVQFLLSGRWESWDVGWVRQYAASGTYVKRVADTRQQIPGSGHQTDSGRGGSTTG